MRTRRFHSPAKAAPAEALKRHIARALCEQDRARDSLAEDSIHDLRVALRRCRTLAEGFGALDEHRDWRRLHRSAKRLQDGLAGLRDTQVMAGRFDALRVPNGTAAEAMRRALRRGQRKSKGEARRALRKFPRRRWRAWKRDLPRRARKLDAAPAALFRLLHERMAEVISRERRWRHTGSRMAAHDLRIAVKHFRYSVQSFWPERYAAWRTVLQRMQDALGEIHDLDVLQGRIAKVARKKSLDAPSVREWLRRIAEAREAAVERYKATAAAGRGVDAGRSHGEVGWAAWRAEIEKLRASNARRRAAASE